MYDESDVFKIVLIVVFLDDGMVDEIDGIVLTQLLVDDEQQI